MTDNLHGTPVKRKYWIRFQVMLAPQGGGPLQTVGQGDMEVQRDLPICDTNDLAAVAKVVAEQVLKQQPGLVGATVNIVSWQKFEDATLVIARPH
jgi:hypothetical protein